MFKSIFNREMQIKIAMRHHFTCTKEAKKKRPEKVGKFKQTNRKTPIWKKNNEKNR